MGPSIDNSQSGSDTLINTESAVAFIPLEDCPEIQACTIFPSHVFSIPTCSDLNGNLFKHLMGYEALVPPAHLYIAENGRLIHNREELYSSSYAVYDELTSQVTNPGRFLSKRVFGRELRLNGSVLSLSLGGLERNYYHFLVEFLARWWIFKSSGLDVDWIVVPTDLQFQVEYLELLGIEAGKIVQWQEYQSIQADQIFYPSLVNNWRPVFHSSGVMNYKKEYLPMWLAHLYSYMRVRAVDCNGQQSRPAKVYISRSKAHTRKILNEDELTNELGAQGFSIVDCEEMTVAQQFSVFSAARVIIAPHGAGFANLLLSRPGVAVLELHPSPEYQDPSHWLSSSIMGHKYSCLVGVPVPSTSANPKDRDFYIDVKKVAEWAAFQSTN